MRFSDLLTMSVNNLFRRKLRTFLTVLGVVIGTASIVVMVSIGIGLKEFTIKQYSSYGSLTAIQVYNYNNGNSSDKKNPEDSFMTDETMKTFEKIPHVTSAYPDLNLNVIMRQGVYEGNVQLHGIPLGAMKNIKLGEGSLPTVETKNMEMVVGNMVAQNFSNAKTGKGYWDTGEMPDIDFINKPMFTIFDTDAYYQSKGNSGGDDGSQKVAAPKKYMLKTAGLVAGGPDEWSDYSYGVYVDLDKLKTQLKQVFKKKPIPGQPTNKKGKPYNYFVYEVLYSLADTVGGTAAMTGRDYAVPTVDGTIHYLKAGKNTSKIIARAQEIQNGYAFSVCECKIYDDKETLLASATMTYYHLRKR